MDLPTRRKPPRDTLRGKSEEGTPYDKDGPRLRTDESHTHTRTCTHTDTCEHLCHLHYPHLFDELVEESVTLESPGPSTRGEGSSLREGTPTTDVDGLEDLNSQPGLKSIGEDETLVQGTKRDFQILNST